jgi:hypothetical protein
MNNMVAIATHRLQCHKILGTRPKKWNKHLSIQEKLKWNTRNFINKPWRRLISNPVVKRRFQSPVTQLQVHQSNNCADSWIAQSIQLRVATISPVNHRRDRKTKTKKKLHCLQLQKKNNVIIYHSLPLSLFAWALLPLKTSTSKLMLTPFNCIIGLPSKSTTARQIVVSSSWTTRC